MLRFHFNLRSVFKATKLLLGFNILAFDKIEDSYINYFFKYYCKIRQPGHWTIVFFFAFFFDSCIGTTPAFFRASDQIDNPVHLLKRYARGATIISIIDVSTLVLMISTPPAFNLIFFTVGSISSALL